MMTRQTNVLDYLGAQDGSVEIQGLSGARLWRTRVQSFVAAVPTPAGSHLLVFQSATDPSAVAAGVLALALEHWDAVLSAGLPATLMQELPKTVDTSFDVVVAFAPALHAFEKAVNPAIHERSFQVFPAHHSEVPGALSDREARTLKSPQFVRFTDISRRIDPVLRARYSLSDHRSVGKDRALAKLSTLLPMVQSLEGERNGYVELENYLGDVLKLTSDGTLRASLTTGDMELTPESTAKLVDSFARDGFGGGLQRTPGSASTGAAAPVAHEIAPELTLETENGTVADRLADWQLRQELEQLSAPQNRFAVVSRAPQQFLQCYINDDGTFDVEYREGSATEHYVTMAPVSRAEMIDIVLHYASNRDHRSGRAWKTAVT